MDKEKIENAMIRSTFLGFEDHRIFTFILHLDYDGRGQGAGNFGLDTPVKDKKGNFVRRIGTKEGMTLIMDILNVLEVDNWEKLKGQYIRVKHNNFKVSAIGHIIKNKWIIFDDYFKKFNEIKKLKEY